MNEGSESGSGSEPLTTGSGYVRLKSVRIWIHNTPKNDKMFREERAENSAIPTKEGPRASHR